MCKYKQSNCVYKFKDRCWSKDLHETSSIKPFFSRAQSAHWFPVSWILGEPTMDDVFAARPSGFQVNFRDFWRINPRIHNNIWYYILIHTLYAHDNWLFTSWFGMKNPVSFMFLRHENFNHTFPGIYHCSVQFSPNLRVITMVSG